MHAGAEPQTGRLRRSLCSLRRSGMGNIPFGPIGEIGYALKVRTAPVHDPPKRQGGLSAPPCG